MRPALKKIKDTIKASRPLIETNGYYATIEKRDQKSLERFIKRHCIKLHHPVPVKAGTKTLEKESGESIYGNFEIDCKVVGVVDYMGHQAVLDVPALREQYKGLWDLDRTCLPRLCSLDTKLLEQIASELP